MSYKLLMPLMLLLLVACNDKQADNKDSATAPSASTTPATAQPTGPADPSAVPPYTIKDSSKIVTTQSGLKYYIVLQGAGNQAQAGNNIVAHYHGLLANGTVFDSSVDREQPFTFVLGQGQVIKGWDEGFGLLKVGTKAVLIVPPELGYGSADRGTIPPNSTLYFHVQLLAANPQ